MDAKELTKVYEDYSSRTRELEKKVEYLEQELEKLRILYGDMKYDILDLQRRKDK